MNFERRLLYAQAINYDYDDTREDAVFVSDLIGIDVLQQHLKFSQTSSFIPCEIELIYMYIITWHLCLTHVGVVHTWHLCVAPAINTYP